jgi:hypothetical protein
VTLRRFFRDTSAKPTSSVRNKGEIDAKYGARKQTMREKNQRPGALPLRRFQVESASDCDIS